MEPTGERTTTADGSPSEWLHVRTYLQDQRYALGVTAAELYPDLPRVADTPLLTAPAWLPAAPIDLATVTLDLVEDAEPPAVTGHEGIASAALPARVDGTRFPSYSAAIAELAPPRVFENRPTYRLLDADLSVADKPRLAFGIGSYFDGIDVGDVCAHEYAAGVLGAEAREGLREQVGDPRDPRRRVMNVGISTLTLRLDREASGARFLLHWRDPAAVGHAGGLFHVLPVGVFQPSGRAEWNTRNDFDLWRNIQREYAEELLGRPEADTETAPLDYPAWPFARRVDELRDQGAIRAYCLGLGTDPLTLANDLLTVTVFDAAAFDELFDGLVADNAEGSLASAGGDNRPGHAFTTETIERYARHEPMQAAGAALLELAWQHREALLA